jgi:Uncharacterized conserved protein
MTHPTPKVISGPDEGEALSHFAASFMAELIKKGLDERAVEDISAEAVNVMINEFGGQQFYVRSKCTRGIAVRNKEIFDRFERNDASISSLSREYGLSSRAVHTIINKERDRRRAERAQDTLSQNIKDDK